MSRAAQFEAVLVALALALTACGGGGNPGQQAANEVAEGFWVALSEGNAAAACALASSQFLEKCEEQAATVAPAPPFDLVAPQASSTEIDGDEAFVEVCTGSDENRRVGLPTPLVAEDGEWRVAGFDLSLTPPAFGCRSQNPPSEASETGDDAARQEVRTAVAEFIETRASDDARATCDLLSPAAQNRIEGLRCEEIFAGIDAQLSPAAARRLAKRVETDSSFGELGITGDRAAVSFKVPGGSIANLELVMEGDSWLIDVPDITGGL